MNEGRVVKCDGVRFCDIDDDGGRRLPWGQTKWRVHFEDTAPNGHMRLTSVVQFMNRSVGAAFEAVLEGGCTDLQEEYEMVILMKEYAVDLVVGAQEVRHLEEMTVLTNVTVAPQPRFPSIHKIIRPDGSVYAKGFMGNLLCKMPAGQPATSDYPQGDFDAIMNEMKKVFWHHGSDDARFIDNFPPGVPFRPTKSWAQTYRVRVADCDAYGRLYFPRLVEMVEACIYGPSRSLLMTGFYGHIPEEVRPHDDLDALVLDSPDTVIVFFRKAGTFAAAGVAQFGSPLSQSAVKCASVSMRVNALIAFMENGTAPKECKDFDLSSLCP